MTVRQKPPQLYRLTAASLLVGGALGATCMYAYLVCMARGRKNPRRVSVCQRKKSLFSRIISWLVVNHTGHGASVPFEHSLTSSVCRALPARQRRRNTGTESIHLFLRSYVGIGGETMESDLDEQCNTVDDEVNVPTTDAQNVTCSRHDKDKWPSRRVPEDKNESDTSTLDSLFSQDSPSSSSSGVDSEGKSGSCHACWQPRMEKKEQHSAAGNHLWMQRFSLTGLHASEKPSVACAFHAAADRTGQNPGSQTPSTFSNRQFYHTLSGAIISRLPSQPSIRRQSLQHLLHTSLHSTMQENGMENADDMAMGQRFSDSVRSLPDNPIYRIIITGGPCSGKTTSMSHLRQEFETLGFRVFCVPEVATLLHSGGVNLVADTHTQRVTQQRVILQMIMMLEDAFYELASMCGQPSLILYDRGTMDGSAYCTEDEWNAVLNLTGYTSEELSDARYDAVVHLVTAAIGAEEFYTLKNNAARSEGLEEARRLDALTRNAWRGHFLVYVVDNDDTGIEGKLCRVTQFIGNVMGVFVGEDGTAKDATLPCGALTTSHAPTISHERNEKKRQDWNTFPPACLSSASTPPVSAVAYLATGSHAFATTSSILSVAKKTTESFPGENGREEAPCGSSGHPPLPDELSNCQSLSLAQPGAAASYAHGNLQRHFFVNRVDLSRIPGDAVVANIVMVTLRPTRSEYRTEIIFRRTRANNAHPVYFRRVTYCDPMEEPLTQVQGDASGSNNRTVAPRGVHVRITRDTFLRLAQFRDPSQPLIQKTTMRFLLNMRHFTLARFERPKEMQGLCRLVTSADTTEDDIGSWVEVEPFSLLTRDGVM